MGRSTSKSRITIDLAGLTGPNGMRKSTSAAERPMKMRLAANIRSMKAKRTKKIKAIKTIWRVRSKRIINVLVVRQWDT